MLHGICGLPGDRSLFLSHIGVLLGGLDLPGSYPGHCYPDDKLLIIGAPYGIRTRVTALRGEGKGSSAKRALVRAHPDLKRMFDEADSPALIIACGHVKY